MRSTSLNRKSFWVSVLILLVLWELASRYMDQEILLPSLFSVGRELYFIVSVPETWMIILATLVRIGVTFGIDLVLALVLGTAAGLLPAVEQALRPLEAASRAVPTMGIVLLALIWLDSEGAPLFVTSLILFPILYRSTVDGIRSIDPDLEEFHQVHRVPFGARLIHFYLPSLFPFLRSGTISALGLGFKVMITAEVLSQPDLAIGTVFQIERARLNTAAVTAWCIFIIVVSIASETLLKHSGTRFAPAASRTKS